MSLIFHNKILVKVFVSQPVARRWSFHQIVKWWCARRFDFDDNNFEKIITRIRRIFSKLIMRWFSVIIDVSCKHFWIHLPRLFRCSKSTCSKHESCVSFVVIKWMFTIPHCPTLSITVTYIHRCTTTFELWIYLRTVFISRLPRLTIKLTNSKKGRKKSYYRRFNLSVTISTISKHAKPTSCPRPHFQRQRILHFQYLITTYCF